MLTFPLLWLFSGKLPPDFALVQSALPVWARLLAEVEDVDVLKEACWALTYLSPVGMSEQRQQIIRAVICSGAVPHLIKLIAHENEDIVILAVRAIGDLLRGAEAQRQTVLDAGLLPPLLELLEHPSGNIRKDACFTVSYILAGSESQIEEAISAGFIPPLVAILQNAGERFADSVLLQAFATGGWPSCSRASNASALCHSESAAEWLVISSGATACAKSPGVMPPPLTASLFRRVQSCTTEWHRHKSDISGVE